MFVSTTVFRESFDVRRRLAELGLQEEWLLLAVQRGYSARVACTLNHPPLYAGISAWAEAVRTLREQLLPNGFKRSDEGNLPFTINDEGTMAIAVATGDEYTGNSDVSPCTKNSRGPRTRNAVEANQYSLNFGDSPVSPEALATIRSRETWILLMHTDTEGRELRCELSRPVNMNEESRVDGWDERIILSVTPLDGDEITITGDENNGPQSPEIIVEVKRRA